MLLVWNLIDGFDAYQLVDEPNNCLLHICHFQVKIRRNHICQVQFDLDGKTAITGSDSGRVVIWDISTGKQLQSLMECKFVNYHALQFTKHYIASGSSDTGEEQSLLRLWSTEVASTQLNQYQTRIANKQCANPRRLSIHRYPAIYGCILHGAHLISSVQQTINPEFLSQTIPIHCQPFPLYQPLLAERALFIREELDFDAIPIHHQIFPSPDDTTKGTSHPAAIKFHKTGVLGGPSYEREITQHVKGTVESMTKPQVTVPERQEHKIQNLNVIIAIHRDLYVHHYENWLQIWLRDGDQWLPDIRDGYHHPTLLEYHLYMAEGCGAYLGYQEDEVDV
ncbi:hypothetical protein EDC04DRAFT_2907708 [Pisolithus marmoratus]|nr:hypothetical protein EDC04DRAFT_2907708 [Pisolithus marmoratus]